MLRRVGRRRCDSARVAWHSARLSVRRIVRAGRELDERAWTAPLCEIADRLDLDSVPRLLSSPLIEMPFACGVVEPTIVLPASAEPWSDNRRRAVLFHELAHVKRHDLVGHTLGRLACAFYWFHPLVWTAARHLRAESERACDDLVLSCGARASDYADHLLDIVISVRHHGAPATAMPMARRRELEGRVLAILDPAVARIGPGRIQSATFLVGFGALALSVAAMAPRAERSGQRVEGSGAEREGQGAERRGQCAERRAQHAEHVYCYGNESKQVTLVTSRGPQSSAAPSPAPSATPTPTPSPTPEASTDSVTLTAVVTNAFGKVSAMAVRQAAHGNLECRRRQSLERQSEGRRRLGEGGAAAQGAAHRSGRRRAPDGGVGIERGGRCHQSSSMRWPKPLRTTRMTTFVRWQRGRSSDSRREVRTSRADHRGTSRSRATRCARRRCGRLATPICATRIATCVETRAVVRRKRSGPRIGRVGAGEYAASSRGASARRRVRRQEPEVRESAAWALAEIEDEDTAPAISAAFNRETNSEVRMAELRALTFLHVDDESYARRSARHRRMPSCARAPCGCSLARRARGRSHGPAPALAPCRDPIVTCPGSRPVLALRP